MCAFYFRIVNNCLFAQLNSLMSQNVKSLINPLYIYIATLGEKVCNNWAYDIMGWSYKYTYYFVVCSF